MIKDIKHLSRRNFIELNRYPSWKGISKDTHAYISIYGNEMDENTPPYINPDYWFTGIKMVFDDVLDADTERFKNLTPITLAQAKQLINFIKFVHYVETELTVVVHCFAGVSRSAAVAKWIHDVLGMNNEKYKGLAFFNSTVYHRLNDALASVGGFAENRGVLTPHK